MTTTNNIIEAGVKDFDRSTETVPVYQYDHGLLLRITGLPIDQDTPVHFETPETDHAVSRLGTYDPEAAALIVPIPGAVLGSDAQSADTTIKAFILCQTPEYGRVIYTVKIPVIHRQGREAEDPDPEEKTYIDQVLEKIRNIEQDIEGYTLPVVSITETGTGHHVQYRYHDGHVEAFDILDGIDGKNGTNGTNGLNGKDGKDGLNGRDGTDGISPTINITDIPGGHRLTIQDAEGRKTIDVMDGADGTNGTDGARGIDGVSPTITAEEIPGGHRLSIQDAEGRKMIDVMDGDHGLDGKDGVSITVAVEAAAAGHTLIITDAEGEHVIDLKNGEKGEKGDKGDTGDTFAWNQIKNTLKPSVASVEDLPRLIEQPVATETSAGTITTASHGFRITNTGPVRTYVNFGSPDAKKATLNGLKPGMPYRLRTRCSYRLLSGDTGNAEPRLVLYVWDDSANPGTYAQRALLPIDTITNDKKGSDQVVDVDLTFTLGENAGMAYLRFVCGDGTASHYADGDYIEFSDMMLTEGVVNAPYCPAMDDLIITAPATAATTRLTGGRVSTADTLATSLVAAKSTNTNALTIAAHEDTAGRMEPAKE